MRRLILFPALLALAIPTALADGAAGRYGLAPGQDGFTRLDTATGEITHCGTRDGVWACDRLTENPTETERRLDALAGEVERLSAGLAELSARVAALAGPPAAVQPAGEEAEAGGLTVAHEAVRRFLDMVRTLKRREA
jgi:hypothetical protein